MRRVPEDRPPQETWDMRCQGVTCAHFLSTTALVTQQVRDFRLRNKNAVGLVFDLCIIQEDHCIRGASHLPLASCKDPSAFTPDSSACEAVGPKTQAFEAPYWENEGREEDGHWRSQGSTVVYVVLDSTGWHRADSNSLHAV